MKENYFYKYIKLHCEVVVSKYFPGVQLKFKSKKS